MTEGQGLESQSSDEEVLALRRTPGLSIESLDPSTKEGVTWPPSKEDLKRLYVDEKLSAAKIAKVYGLKTRNPRSAAFLVTYHLKKHGIERRDRIEELRKETEAVVVVWTVKYPKKKGGEQTRPAEQEAQADEPLRLTAEEKAVIELLQHKNLSSRHFDPETKGRVKAAMEGLHWTRGFSLNDIAEMVGNKTSGYSSYLFKELGIEARPFKEAQLKGIHDHVRIYERKPFNGTDEDKAYLLGISQGDLHVSRPFGDAVMVTTSSTHPAMCDLFDRLFSPHGHVSHYPRYKKDTNTYEWNIGVTLDASFEFLLQKFEQSLPWVRSSEEITMPYLSGLLDAEGSIVITKDQFQKVALFVDYSNSNKALLDWIRSELISRGYFCSVRINKRKGVRTKKWGIVHRKDYWQLSSYGMDNIQKLIAELKPRHSEKIARREIALAVHKGQEYSSVAAEIASLRSRIKDGVRRFVLQAEQLHKQARLERGGHAGSLRR
ncbi:MAG TPA: hypothetical protein VND40_01245 [Nitrososphaerales archaeon]|nr:hypothetical protein [Nitrososphaerales archaeon]